MPAPASVARTETAAPRLTVRLRTWSVGGLVSPIQSRNENAPGCASAGVSKTMSYAPAAGMIAPDTGTSCRKIRRYGLRLNGSAA